MFFLLDTQSRRYIIQTMKPWQDQIEYLWSNVYSWCLESLWFEWNHQWPVVYPVVWTNRMAYSNRIMGWLERTQNRYRYICHRWAIRCVVYGIVFHSDHDTRKRWSRRVSWIKNPEQLTIRRNRIENTLWFGKNWHQKYPHQIGTIV